MRFSLKTLFLVCFVIAVFCSVALFLRAIGIETRDAVVDGIAESVHSEARRRALELVGYGRFATCEQVRSDVEPTRRFLCSSKSEENLVGLIVIESCPAVLEELGDDVLQLCESTNTDVSSFARRLLAEPVPSR